MTSSGGGVKEVMVACPKCGETTPHQAASDGTIHCLRCVGDNVPGITAPPAEAPLSAAEWRRRAEWNSLPAHVQQQYLMQHAQQSAPQPPHWQQQQPRQRDGVVMGTIKLAGFIVALLVLGTVGMCVYVCGSVATTKPGYRSETPAATAPAPSSAERLEQPKPEDPMDAVVRGWSSDTGLDLQFVKPNEIHVRVESKLCTDAMLKRAIAKVRPIRMKPWGIRRFTCTVGLDEKAVDVPR